MCLLYVFCHVRRASSRRCFFVFRRLSIGICFVYCVQIVFEHGSPEPSIKRTLLFLPLRLNQIQTRFPPKPSLSFLCSALFACKSLYFHRSPSIPQPAFPPYRTFACEKKQTVNWNCMSKLKRKLKARFPAIVSLRKISNSREPPVKNIVCPFRSNCIWICVLFVFLLEFCFSFCLFPFYAVLLPPWCFALCNLLWNGTSYNIIRRRLLTLFATNRNLRNISYTVVAATMNVP